jgi:hypothetical protein
MTECNEQSWLFQELGSRKVEVDFGGGYLSSDGGGLILREFEHHSGLLRDLAGCFVDYRNPLYIEHSVQELVSQRVYGLILGYEDLNDHDHLRRDPVHGLICGKRDPLGQDRLLERDKGKALAAHSTLNRLELSAQSIDPRYHKIQVQPDEVEDLLIKRAVKAIPRKSAEIVLDFDATDDPLHGRQEGGYFNGYFGHYCYLPLYCFCGNIPFLAKLRDCKPGICAWLIYSFSQTLAARPAIEARLAQVPAEVIALAPEMKTDPAMVERYFADPAGFTKAVMNQPDPTPTPTPEPVWARFHWIKSRAEYDALPTGSMYYYVLPDGTHAISGDGRAVDLFSKGDRRHVNPVLWIRDRRFDGDYFLNHPDAQSSPLPLLHLIHMTPQELACNLSCCATLHVGEGLKMVATSDQPTIKQ